MEISNSAIRFFTSQAKFSIIADSSTNLSSARATTTGIGSGGVGGGIGTSSIHITKLPILEYLILMIFKQFQHYLN